MGERRWTLLSAIAGSGLVLAAPVLSWFFIGDLSERGYERLDHAVEPPQLPTAVVLAAVLGASAVASAAVVVLVLGQVRGWGRPRWAQVAGPLVLLGAIAALVERIMTAGVIGANIGAGLAVLFFAPVSLMLVALAGWRGAVLLRRRHPVR